MKRWLVGLGVAVTLTGISSGSELLANRDFETGDWPPWELFGQGWRIGATHEARGGWCAAANDADPLHVDEWRGIAQSAHALPGRVYSAAVFTRSTNDVESSQSWLEIQWWDTNGSVLLQHTAPVVPSDQEYARARIPYMVAPYGAATVSVRGIVRMTMPPVTNLDTHLFDDFSLVLQPTGPIVNASFETADLSGWEIFGPSWRTSSFGDNHWGLYGAVNDVLPSHTISDEWRGIYQNNPVAPGERYSVAVSIRALSVDTSSSWLEVQWLDASMQVIQQLQTAPVTADQPFRRSTLNDLVAPPGTAWMSARVIVRMNAPPPDPDFHIFDDFIVQPTTELSIGMDAGGPSVRWQHPAWSESITHTADLAGGMWAPMEENPAATTGGWRIVVGRSGSPSFFRLMLTE